MNGVLGTLKGTSTAAGTVVLGVTSATAGSSDVWAAADLNGNGSWDQASEPVTNPACHVTFQGQTPTQSISGHIYDCTGGVGTVNERLGGSIWATGPQSVPTVTNPLPSTNVAAGTYTMSASAPAGYEFVTCGGSATPGNPPTTATTSVVVPSGDKGVGIFYVVQATVPSQTIAGHIYDCTGGVATANERLGGSIWATGPQSLPVTGNPLNPANVLAGTYTMSASAPAGYQFVTCGGSATPGNPPVTATTTVVVPSGDKGVGIFYVTPANVPSQTIAGHIYDCTGGVATTFERLGGSILAGGPQSLPVTANPMNPVSVLAGTYAMSASAPAGYQFVTCGGSATPGNPPTTATTSVVVPPGSSGVGIFYVAPTTAPSQSISGHIYDCTGGVATTFERLGGSIWASGPQNLPVTGNPLNPLSVLAGTYTMSASAPAGYQFVTCGGNATPGSPPTTATTAVVVPTNSSGVGIFYVAPATVSSQTISGHIYDCSGGVATANERFGGSIWASGPQALPAVGNPLFPTSVLAGTYTMSASAPAGYQFVTCGGNATPGSPPTTATTSVVVPTNGAGMGIFYVAPATVPSQTIEGHIYDCTTGTATMSEVPGGILSAAGPQSLPAGPNPMAPANVASGTYTMSALAPPGYHFVTCGGTATIYSPPTTGATSVVVPTGGAGVGVFYVAPDPITFTAVKVNNADGQGAWLQRETAPSAGATVPFRVTVINTSTVSITVASLTDSWPGQAPFSPSCSQALVGTVLAPGASATCEFSVPNYAPAAAASLTDTATVTACQTSIPGNCAVAKPTSTVDVVQVLGESITPPPPPTAPTVTPSTPTQLAFTGPSVPVGRMLGLAGLLLAAGLGLLAVSRPGGRRACWRR